MPVANIIYKPANQQEHLKIISVHAADPDRNTFL
jgi:hypothetical protein